MIKIAICDDESLSARYMERLLKEYDFGEEIVQIDSYTSGENLFRKAADKEYDILIMDIELSEGEPEYVHDNGMTLSRRIKDMFPDTIVIFFTGKPGYEKKLLQYESFRYMTKPIQVEHLYRAVRSALRRLKVGKEKNKYYIRKKGVTVGLDVDQILYMVSNKRIVSVVCKQETIEFYGRIDFVQKEMLKTTDDFVRVGKSYLVNAKHVARFSSINVVMIDGVEISIGRGYQKAALEKLEGLNRK